ncbi:hypothetical protein EON65_39185 [archaeon]|nr:MAG: hypothetical protein EON65_39185 [archaeon]
MRCYRSGVRDTDLLDAVCNLIRRDCGKELGINSVQNAEITESGGQGTAGQASSVADDSVSADMQDSVKKVKCINVACRSRGPMTCIHRYWTC